MKKNYLCIHGHFYQPPRENPWLNTIARQDSASPFHDWNEKINHDCYLPNAFARVLDNKGQIRGIVNNYKYISFNFGPTLLSWLETHEPQAYAGILEADRFSVKNLGHGNAIAQVYNHIIMPLATTRDKEIQVKWGIADFEHRFGRKPEGMWLAETAVDVETLEILAENNIHFTILAPDQAAAYREMDADWLEIENGNGLDPSRPYKCPLPSGKSISIFYYDGPLSHAIAFEKLLVNGDLFYGRIKQIFDNNREWPQIVSLATDGESYGHHFLHGEMALAYCLRLAQEDEDIEIINYATYLEKFPIHAETRIKENSSWSCVHGVGRWKEDCGCNTGSHGDWNQKWRGPLREAFDLLRDETDKYLQDEGKRLFQDPDLVVNNYISLVLNRHTPRLHDQFSEKYLIPNLSPEHRESAFLLLEMKYMSMLTYTSCAWFFDDINGLEPVQIMKYAARLIDLGFINNMPLSENKFISILREARSNDSEAGSGSDIYQNTVLPEKFSLRKISAHLAVHKLLWPDYSKNDIHSYLFDSDFFKTSTFNQLTLAAGKVRITCPVTQKKFPFEYVSMHLSGLDINIYSKYGDHGKHFDQMVNNTFEIFENKSLTDLIRYLPEYFGDSYYNINDLFVDDKHQVIEYINKGSLIRLKRIILDYFDENKKLFIQLNNAKYPLPPSYKLIIENAMDYNLSHFISQMIDGDSREDGEVAYKIIEQIILMQQSGIVLTEAQINNNFLPKMLLILERVLDDYSISPKNYFSILREFGKIVPKIDWWLLQNRLLNYLQDDPDPNLIIDEDLVKICEYLKIRISDFA